MLVLARGEPLPTYTGGRFYPFDPRPEDVRFDDIVAALSKLCRYAGHCLKFYSVAEHCVHVASAAPADLKLAALLHDASEAYLVDVPSSVKPYLPDYVALEDRVAAAVARKFGVPHPVPELVKRLDTAIRADEVEQNMGRPAAPWLLPDPLGLTLKFWPPAQAAYEFTAAFHRYGGRP
jgi:uncharacterized protein